MNRGVLSLGAVAVAAALILAAPAVPAWRIALWGTHAWTFLTPAALAGVLTASAMIAALMLWAPPFPSSIRAAFLCALIPLPFFLLFHDATHLLGDGRLWISVLAEQRVHHAHEPLAFAAALLVTLGKMVTASIIEPRMEKYSAVLGVIAVFLMIRTAPRLADGRRGRWTALGLMLGMGTLQFGFGYIESYPLFWVAVLLFVHLGLETLLGRLPFAWTGLALGFAIAVHGAGVLLAPAFLVLLLAVRPGLAALALSFLGAAVPVAFAYAALPAMLPSASATAPAGFHLSAWSRVFREFHLYNHGAAAWVLGQLNRWTLVSGAAIGLVVTGLLFRRRSDGSAGPDARVGFLAAAALALALPAVVLDMEGSRGAAADWDAFAVAAVPLMALAAVLWAPEAERSKASRGLLAAIAGLGAIAAFSFVGVNASGKLSLERFAGLADHVFITPRAKSWAYESLAIWYRDAQENDESATYYEKAVRFQPTNPRLALNAASMLVQSKRYREAADMYRRLTKLQADDPRMWFSLGAMLEQSGKPDSAIVAYRENLKRDPNAWETMNYLARLVLKTPAGLEEGRALIRRSLAVNPDQPTKAWGEGMLKALDEFEAKRKGGS